jgi:hypothetical protein
MIPDGDERDLGSDVCWVGVPGIATDAVYGGAGRKLIVLVRKLQGIQHKRGRSNHRAG